MAINKDIGLKRPQTQEKESRKEQKALMLRLIISAGMGLAVFAILLVTAAAICLRLDLAQDKLAWVSIPIASLSAFFAGALHVRPLRKQGLLLGLLSGAAFYVGALLLSVILSHATLGVNAVFLLMSTLICGAAGGIYTANRKPSSNKASAKRRR